MAEAQNNKALLHRKEWQSMTPAPVTTAAGMFVISDNANLQRFSLYMTSATVHYLYDHSQDEFVPIASGAFGTALAAGACGCYVDWSLTYTANGGSTTTITVNVASFNINGFVVGQTVEFLNGNNIGFRRTITAINTPGTATGTITLTFDSAVGTAVANADTFRISSGRFFCLMAGTLGATSFKQYDIGTGVWTACTNTGLSATWGTDGRMVHPGMLGVSYESVTDADVHGDTTIGLMSKTWTADQWINYQVRIISGTGMGQVRVITDNTTTTLTVASMTPDPDATSDFVIEGDENAIYLLGNAALTMYKYSISGNSWATVAPTAARGGVTAAGMSADFVGMSGSTDWANVNAIKNGRYIYSIRGGTTVLDRFDISGGSNGAGTWELIAYHPVLQTFAAGDSTDWEGEFIYIAKEGTAAIPQRVYRYSVVDNALTAITEDWYLGGAAVLGNKIWIRNLSTAKLVKWLYCLQSTSTVLRRIMIF